MNEEDRKTIRDNIPNLVDVLDFNAILPLLSFKRLFTTPMIEQLNAHRNEREKKLVLLSDLRKRGPTAFQDFVDLLAITAQHKALQFLKPELFLGIDLSQRRRSSDCLLPNFSNTLAPFTNHSQSTNGSEEYYNMSSNPRGFCIIIANIHFKSPHVPHAEKKSAEIDAKNMKRAFKTLGFQVDLHRDLTATAMFDLLQDYASKTDELDKHDALAVVIFTHGESDFLYGVDGNGVEINSLLTIFNNKYCRELVGKPKMFFIEACRGLKIDRGVQRTVFDSRPDNFRAGQDVHKVTNYSVKPRIASFEDMLISYATIVEHASVHHNTDNGSWYGHSLSFHLLQSAHEKDLLEILKDVEKSVRLEETFEGHKQTTCYENRGFSKKLFFNPNFYD